MGPGAALEVLPPSDGVAWGLLADMWWLLVAVWGGFSIDCFEELGWEVSSFMMGLLDMPDVGRWGDWCGGPWDGAF